MTSSPEASSKPPEKPADAPPSPVALSDKARMKLEKQLQTQENKLQKLLAKSGEIGSVEELRTVIKKETLFEPALACLKKQAGIAAELKGVIDPKSFVEKAAQLEALEKVFIKNLANGNALTVAVGTVQKQFAEALSPAKPAEQAAASPDTTKSATPDAPSFPEPTIRTADTPAKPAAVSAESTANAGAGAEKAKENTTPPPATAPAAANHEKTKPATKQNGNGNRTRPTTLERVQHEAKGFEQGLAIPPAPAGAKETAPPTTDTPPQKKTEQADAQKNPNTSLKTEKLARETVKKNAPDPVERIMRDVKRASSLKRKRGNRDIVVKGAQMAEEIGRLARIFESDEFNEKSAEERERTIRESVALLTTHERLRRDLLAAFEQKGFLTKGGKTDPNAKKEAVEQKTTPALPELTPPPKAPLPEKEKNAVALLHQVLTDIERVPAGETIPRRMSDGSVVGIPGTEMAAGIRKLIAGYQTLPFPKRSLKERREIVLRDIEDITSHPLLRADLERAFAAKGWLPQVVEPAQASVETKTTAPKPPLKTEPKKTEPAPATEKARAQPAPPSVPVTSSPSPVETAKSVSGPPPKDAPATLAGNLPTKESVFLPPSSEKSAPVVTIPLMLTRDMERQLASRGLSQESIDKLKPEEAWTILNIAKIIETSGAKTEAALSPAFTSAPVAEKGEAPKSPEKTEAPPLAEKTKTQSTLAELIRARVQKGSVPVTAGFKEPFVEKKTTSPAITPTVERAASILSATPAEKTETSKSAETGPSLAELLRERGRGGAKKESASIPPQPPVLSRTEAAPPKLPEAISVLKSTEVPPTKPPEAATESAPKGPAPEQQRALTFEQLTAWPKEDLAKLAAAVQDEAVWATALQGMTTSALEKAVQAALPPERVDNFALEILTMPIKTKPEIEAKQRVIIAEAQKVLSAKADKKTE